MHQIRIIYGRSRNSFSSSLCTGANLSSWAIYSSNHQLLPIGGSHLSVFNQVQSEVQNKRHILSCYRTKLQKDPYYWAKKLFAPIEASDTPLMVTVAGLNYLHELEYAYSVGSVTTIRLAELGDQVDLITDFLVFPHKNHHTLFAEYIKYHPKYANHRPEVPLITVVGC